MGTAPFIGRDWAKYGEVPQEAKRQGGKREIPLKLPFRLTTDVRERDILLRRAGAPLCPAPFVPSLRPLRSQHCKFRRLLRVLSVFIRYGQREP
jgi:hypothetical protein